MTKKILVLFALLFLNVMTCVYADTSQVIKEDSTPPDAEPALTIEQIPPIDSKTHKAMPIPLQTPEAATTQSQSISQKNDSTVVQPNDH